MFSNSTREKVVQLKKFAYKLLMTFIIIVLAMAAISLTYLAYFNVSIRENYEQLHNASMDKALLEFENELSHSFNDIEKTQSTGDVPLGYYARAILDDSKNLTIFTASSQSTKVLADNIYNTIVEKESSVNKILINDSIQYIAITKKQDDGNYIMLLQEEKVFIKRIGVFELENAILCNNDGLIIASTQYMAEKNIYQLVQHESFGDLSNQNRIYSKKTSKEKYVTSRALALNDYYIVGYSDVATMNAFIEKDKMANLFYIIGLSLASFVGAFIIIITYVYYNNKNLVGRFTRGKYSVFIDKYGRLLYKNKKFKKEFQYSDIISYAVEDNEQVRESLSNNGEITLKLTNKTGETKYLRFLSAKAFVGYRLLGVDATEFMVDYIDALYKKNCDSHLQLPNTTQLRIDYNNILRQQPNEPSCVALIEVAGLYKFKVMFGNKFYIDLLKSFALRLQDIFPNMVYYSGSNNFMIFTHDEESTNYILNESTKYISLLNAPFKLDNQCIKTDFKMGLSKEFYPRDKLDLRVPINQAKQIFYSIKHSKNKIWAIYFDSYMKDDLTFYEDKQAIMDLIANDQLTLYFQPQYSINKKKIVGFEALTRIKKKTNITIAEFIELAEKNGSIIEIGTRVYQQAMEFAKKLHDEDATVSLNVSPVQLLQEGFVENFLTEYRNHNLKKDSLAIEITESFLVSSYDVVIAKLNMIKKEGIKIHLDDFGIEYSSMLYLKKLPINVIKIDKEFIRDIDTNTYSSIITESVVKLIKKLDLVGIAEGVETIEQLNALKVLGCDIIQGYYISKAVPEEAALKLFYEYKDKK